jgi:hypothetical protein
MYGISFPTEDEYPETSGESLLQELVALRAEVAQLRANPHQGTITALAEAARAVIGINTDEAEAVRRLVVESKRLHDALRQKYAIACAPRAEHEQPAPEPASDLEP